MENTRLLQLLRTFSVEELRGLKKFVRSPYFNQRPEVVAILDWLEKPLKKGKPVPDKKEAFSAVFGDKSFDDHRLRMATSFLFQAARQFLMVDDFLTDTPAKQLRLTQLLRQRKLPDMARKQQQAAAKELRRQKSRNADYQEQQYQLLLEQYRSAMNRRSEGPLPLQELSDQLDHSYLSRKLWQSCFMLSHQTVYNTEYHYGLLDAAIDQIDPVAMKAPAIALYYHCYRALSSPEQKTHFQEFKRLLLQNSNIFPENELRDLYVLAINFCIRQYNAGNQEYLPEQFVFYKDGLAKGYFLVEGLLSHYTYQNAATIGLVLRELDWVDQLIHSYRDKLPVEYRESLFSFNLARLKYQRRELDHALQLLQKAEYKDLLLHLAAKTLQLKIYYELEAFDLLESHLQAFQMFIRRKKVLGYHRENYLNTIHFTRQLLERNFFDKQQTADLVAELEATKAVAEKEWLLERVVGRKF